MTTHKEGHRNYAFSSSSLQREHSATPMASSKEIKTTINEDVLGAGKALGMLKRTGEDMCASTSKKKRVSRFFIHLKSSIIMASLPKQVELLFDVDSPELYGADSSEKRRELVTTVLTGYGIPEDCKMEWTKEWEKHPYRNQDIPTTVHAMTVEAFEIILDLIRKDSLEDCDLFTSQKEKVKMILNQGKNVNKQSSWLNRLYIGVVTLFIFKILLGPQVDPADEKTRLLDFIEDGLNNPQHQYHIIGIPLMRFFCEYTGGSWVPPLCVDQILTVNLSNFSRNVVNRANASGVWNIEFFESFLNNGQAVRRPDGQLATPTGIFFNHALVLLKLVPGFFNAYSSQKRKKICLGGSELENQKVVNIFYENRWYSSF